MSVAVRRMTRPFDGSGVYFLEWQGCVWVSGTAILSLETVFQSCRRSHRQLLHCFQLLLLGFGGYLPLRTGDCDVLVGLH